MADLLDRPRPDPVQLQQIALVERLDLIEAAQTGLEQRPPGRAGKAVGQVDLIFLRHLFKSDNEPGNVTVYV